MGPLSLERNGANSLAETKKKKKSDPVLDFLPSVTAASHQDASTAYNHEMVTN